MCFFFSNLERPTFVKPMESKDVMTGTSSVLECMASGSPKPTLFWLKDGQPIEGTERHFFAAEDQLLIIVDTIMSDAGTYTCSMTNELGRENGIMQLNVKPAVTPSVVRIDEMTGIVIITVVCCAVGTSIIWVVIIYQTKRGRGCSNYVAGNNGTDTTLRKTDQYGNGSTQNSSNAVLNQTLKHTPINSTNIPIGETRALLGKNEKYARATIVPVTTNQTPKSTIENYSLNSDYNYDDLSCKDSGTGDSAKRSCNNDDSMNNLNSDNGTSEICCIEIDKTSPTVSYTTSPITTPCNEEINNISQYNHHQQYNDKTIGDTNYNNANGVVEDDDIDDDDDNKIDVHTSSTLINKPSENNYKINIQTNKLNEFLQPDNNLTNSTTNKNLVCNLVTSSSLNK